jgi:hypothetical protein
MDRKVGFNIEPIVHIYKKRTAYMQKEQSQNLTDQEQSQSQSQNLTDQEQQHQHQEQAQHQEQQSNNQPLKIDIPQVYTEEVWEEPPAYDNSPMSPRTQQEITYLRYQERQTRVTALKNAMIDFTNNASPESIIGQCGQSPLSQRSTAGALSPLCLSG